MQKKIKIKINGKIIKANKEQTIAEVAIKNGIDIPLLCSHSDLKFKPNCRICSVEIKGLKGLYPACSTKIKEGMEILTDSPRAKKARKINLELIFAQHTKKCLDCVRRYNCQLLDLVRRYQIKANRFLERKKKYPIYQFGPILLDSSKCIDCRNCVEICKTQGVGFLEIKKKGHSFQIAPSHKKNKDCVYCGQCIVHCPVGVFEGSGEFEEIEKPFKEKDKILIVQFAPALRVSLGEFFNMPYGTVVTEKIAAALKKLGAFKVFDTSLGADFTTVEEANALIERLTKERNLPMFTSCCPAWVKFVEFYYPSFVPNLTTVRSPHIILGGLIKTFWAKKEGIDPERIKVISIMPCVAKKYEIARRELKINNLKPVDCVLTTRELAYLLIKNKVDLKTIKPQKLDTPLGFPSGAGVIYGASGGVMEAALRTSYEKLSGKRLLNIEFKKIRGMEEIKEAKMKIGKRLIKIAAVNGLGGAKKILEKLKKKKNIYDYIEVMACPGGCIGGGGQPLPTDDKIRKKRAKGLYNIDSQKKVKMAHKNPIVEKVYKTFLKEEKTIHSICHTRYFRKKKGKIKIIKTLDEKS